MFLLALPTLVKICCTFGLILLLSRKLPLYASLFAGTFIIGLWMHKNPIFIAQSVWNEATSEPTLWLAGVIIMILILSAMLQKSGQLDRIVSTFRRLSPDPRFTAAAMPALIGLLPMPGGALFSAPMVQTAVPSDDVEPELKVAINYWFRHIWEYWWPLYPGIILGISLFGLDSWKLIVAHMPLTIGAIIAGVIFILSGARIADVDEPGLPAASTKDFLKETAPILVVIIVFIGMQAFAVGAKTLLGISISSPKYSGLAIGLLAAMALVIYQNSMGWKPLKESALNPGMLTMAMIIFAIMSFKGVLVDTKAIEDVRWELARYRIPPLLIIALLPFISGMVTGIAVGFVGASFPLVAALLPAGHSPYPFAVLAFGFGFMGMMLSPVHLCLVVTRQYFHADMLEGYRYLWKPVLFGLVWTVVLSAVYRFVLG